jgi:hypothetical protein
MHESEFAATYGMDTIPVMQRPPDDAYFFQDNGSDILAVAHLDTVMFSDERTANFVDTEAGPVVFSGALDDRLGAYIILELLPKLGITCDILLTVGEENGASTAGFFETDKHYHWMIEFDRGGTDVVMYQYEDPDTMDLVRKAGARIGDGSFSDVSYLEHLEIKGFNWGVGYQDYHGPRSHAFLEVTFKMVAQFLIFHEANADTYLPHDMDEVDNSWWGGYFKRRSTVSDWDFADDNPTREQLAEALGPDDPDETYQGFLAEHGVPLAEALGEVEA